MVGQLYTVQECFYKAHIQILNPSYVNRPAIQPPILVYKLRRMGGALPGELAQPAPGRPFVETAERCERPEQVEDNNQAGQVARSLHGVR